MMKVENVFVHLYRDETEEEKGILKAQLCCFDGATCGLAEGLDIYIKKTCYAHKSYRGNGY